MVFYRRKVLLALVEVFGCSLPVLDCQLLLFLFCLRRGKNYYDFFPATSGPCSFLLFQDKDRLTTSGFLAPHECFVLNNAESYIQQIDSSDRAALYKLATEVGNTRGETLAQQVYADQPYYAPQNRITHKIFRVDESELFYYGMLNMSDIPALFTIGYEGLSIDAYINVLLANHVKALVDVRKNPLSMKYGFSKKKLSEYVGSAGLLYFHIPDLGVPSILRRDLHSDAAYQKLFTYYSHTILPEQTNALDTLYTLIHQHRRVALTCFEADYHCCHRHKISEYLAQDKNFETPVIHLDKTCTSPASIMYTSLNSKPLLSRHVNALYPAVGSS